jgi:hypothetical protein
MIPAGLAGIPDLLSDLTGKLSQLFRAEMRLAQAELTDKATAAATAVVPAVIGAILLIPVLVVLLGAAAEGLVEQGMSRALSLLLVGVVALVVAAGLVWMGIQRLNRLSVEPHRVVRQVKRDVAMAKSHLEAS